MFSVFIPSLKHFISLGQKVCCSKKPELFLNHTLFNSTRMVAVGFLQLICCKQNRFILFLCCLDFLHVFPISHFITKAMVIKIVTILLFSKYAVMLSLASLYVAQHR